MQLFLYLNDLFDTDALVNNSWNNVKTHDNI